jgi:hypothetical protein
MFGALTPSLSSLSGSASGFLGVGAGTAGTPLKHTPERPTHRKSTSGPPSISPTSRATISLEYASLRYQSHCPLGMYVIPFIDDPFIWDATLFIHQGEPYAKYIFIPRLADIIPEARVLHRFYPQISLDFSPQLPRTAPDRPLRHRCLPPSHFAS